MDCSRWADASIMSGLSSCEGELAGLPEKRKKKTTSPVLMEDIQCLNESKGKMRCVFFYVFPFMCLYSVYFMTKSCWLRCFLSVRISIPLPCWYHYMDTQEKPGHLYRPLVVSCSTGNATLVYFSCQVGQVVVFRLDVLCVVDKTWPVAKPCLWLCWMGTPRWLWISDGTYRCCFTGSHNVSLWEKVFLSSCASSWACVPTVAPNVQTKDGACCFFF